MLKSNYIRLFWWNEKKFHKKEKENYGDLLGKYLVEKIASKKVIWAKPSKLSILDFFQPIYVTIGSVLTHVNKKCIVWGSGIVSKEYSINKATFLAVRGPQTRNLLMQQGHDIPLVFGDPAILLPNYYYPKIEKIYKFGIVPHYVDFEFIKNLYKDEKQILIIDLMTNSIEDTTDQFLKCEKIIASSLHGIIVPHSYGIPAVWQKFSGNVFGDDIKYQDYFESVGLPVYTSLIRVEKMSLHSLKLLFKNKRLLPNKEVLEKLRNGLMEVCPFK